MFSQKHFCPLFLKATKTTSTVKLFSIVYVCGHTYGGYILLETIKFRGLHKKHTGPKKTDQTILNKKTPESFNTRTTVLLKQF